MAEERQPAQRAQIYDSITAKLEYIKRTLLARERPMDVDTNRLLLGVYAAREFHTSDPEFADVLFKIVMETEEGREPRTRIRRLSC